MTCWLVFARGHMLDSEMHGSMINPQMHVIPNPYMPSITVIGKVRERN